MKCMGKLQCLLMWQKAVRMVTTGIKSQITCYATQGGWEENSGLIKGHAQLIIAAGHREPEVSRRSR